MREGSERSEGGVVVIEKWECRREIRETLGREGS